jgi:hypothetical protein
MDETLKPTKPTDRPRPRPDLDSWRGDLPSRKPSWRRRPRAEAMLDLWNAARPLIARIGEEQSWT